ncbi:MAG: hypothetical protein SGJ20_10225 [Planctomycetota bacterium]|nr:hypothetical protein [Planctomycetota bacterium]
MATTRFRFIQSSDFRIELPPHGLAEIPDHLRDLLIDAPYRAVSNVVEAALRHEVDFVLLTGGLVDPTRCGPRGMIFLRDQLQRLADRQIPIYWSASGSDPVSQLPARLHWPATVHFFPIDRIGRFEVTRHGQVLAELLGQSAIDSKTVLDFCQAGIPLASERLFSIAAFHGPAQQNIEAPGIDYIALGGAAEVSTEHAAAPTIHYAGTPQGRSPAENGAHSCTLVEVDTDHQVRLSTVPTDVLRFVTESLSVSPDVTATKVEERLRESIGRLQDTHRGLPLLISWKIASKSPDQPVHSSIHPTVLLGILRGEFGYGMPVAWPAQIEVVSPATLPAAWQEQETLLGDFLRAARRLEMDEAEPLDLNGFLPENTQAKAILRAAGLQERGTRRRQLHQSAWLGKSLLSPEEAEA